MKPRVLTIVGTRPEAIKMAPVVAALDKAEGQDRVQSYLGFTRQHEYSMVAPVFEMFALHPDFVLEYERFDPSLSYLTARLVEKISVQLSKIQPHYVLVHGDTTTALCSALAAFYNKIPVGHVEAGLRTARFESPFPEEMNRRLIARLASIHFSPTIQAARNLYSEGVPFNRVYVTGNTVVDALNQVLAKTTPGAYNQFPMIPAREVVLITCHRRESWGAPLEALCDIVLQLAMKHEDYIFVWPLHPNPNVKKVVERKLTGVKNVRLYPPMDYPDFVWLLKVSQVVVTDSGGVLEEAAVLGVPALILRQETERPEALDLEGVELVGYDFEILSDKIVSFIETPPKTSPSRNFGLGDAGELIVETLLQKIDGELNG